MKINKRLREIDTLHSMLRIEDLLVQPRRIFRYQKPDKLSFTKVFPNLKGDRKHQTTMNFERFNKIYSQINNILIFMLLYQK